MKRILASLLALTLSASFAYAGGGGIPSGLPGGPPAGIPGAPPGTPPIPPGSGAASSSNAAGSAGRGQAGTDKAESKATVGFNHANSALKDAFAQVQDGMAKGLAQALQSLESGIQ